MSDHVIKVRARFDASAGPISLKVGVHNRVVVTPPRLVEYATASGFAVDSAFPGPGMLVALKGVQEAVDGTGAQAMTGDVLWAYR